MNRSFIVVTVIALLGIAGCANNKTGTSESLPGPVVSDPVKTAIETFNDKVELARESGTALNGDLMRNLSNDSLGTLDVATMSADDIEALYGGKLLIYSRKQQAALTRLAELARQPDVEGAKAAANRIMFIRVELSKPEAQAEALTTALRHPALKEALEQGGCGTLLRGMRDAKTDVLKPLAPDIYALKDMITTDMPPSNARSLGGVMDALMLITEESDRDAREPMRLACLKAAKSADKSVPESETDLKKQMKTAIVKLDGAYARGQLVGYPTPDLNITWSSGAPAIKSLKDLRGKVVVMDFWATWCGPCVGSFPDVRHLQAHYQGYPVEIIGVTSLQGRHVTPDHVVIDCKGDPAKEVGFMPEYMKQQDMTWTVAYSEQDVFNPEYGIRGIPHVVITDTKGVLRYRGLHPHATPFAEKCRMIDGLLQEAGLPVPPPEAPGEEPKDAANSAGTVNPG